MNKVICEPGRRGMRTKDRKGRKKQEGRIPDKEQPRKETGNLHARWIPDWYSHKESGYTTKPFRRYLRSCVGRKWDDVYSEICKAFRSKNAITQEFDYWIKWSVALDVYIEDKKVYEPDGKLVNDELYVHPKTGILTLTPKEQYGSRYRYERKSSTPSPADFVKGDHDKHCYVRDEHGAWWECWLAKFAEAERKPYKSQWTKMTLYTTVYDRKYDVHLRQHVKETDYILKQTYGSWSVYCLKRRQLNKREIKHLKSLNPGMCQGSFFILTASL